MKFKPLMEPAAFKKLVEHAADKAGIPVEDQVVAANGLLLLVGTIVECGQLKLPRGALGIIAEVLQERTGHRYTTGLLRWYRALLTTDEVRVERYISLPGEYRELLVRSHQEPVHAEAITGEST
jgi:hypothetical protein